MHSHIGTIALSAAAFFLGSTAKLHAQSTLWVVDDSTRMVYETTLDGVALRSFRNPMAANSSIAVDAANGTLWGTAEGPASGPGDVVNFSKTGVVIDSFSASAYGGMRPEGVSVDPDNGSLWIVDDSDVLPVGVFNVTRAGDRISFFSTSIYDPVATSPQSLTIDPADGTLWITDNRARNVYHVTRSGGLLATLPSASFVGVSANVQGISFDLTNESLWVSNRTTATIYNITQSGSVIGSFASSTYDPAASSPTGVAFDSEAVQFIDLGAAAGFAVLGLEDKKFEIKDRDCVVYGDVGIGPYREQGFDGGQIIGTLVVDPRADNSNRHRVRVTSTVVRDLRPAVADAKAAARFAASLPTTQSFRDIKRSTTIVGRPGLNVIRIEKIELQDRRTIVLRGPIGAYFVVNVEEKLEVEESAVLLDGGLRAENVIFVMCDDGDVELKEDAVFYGTILAPWSKAKLEKDATLLGSLIAGEDIELKEGASVGSPGVVTDR